MKVVIAIDSFKGSLTSMEAGQAAREGVLKAIPEAEVVVKPMADGGEGTTDALVEGLDGTFVSVDVTGPMEKSHGARYGILQDGTTAVMEMAEAAGIILVDSKELNPRKAVTTGVGEMILDAMDKGCREFLIGIGGSATTEGGIGMLQALGYRFYDEAGHLLSPYFESLGKIAAIDAENVSPLLKECHFQIACDVTNPLCGEQGSVYVYGPQKGVKAEEREEMDQAMRHYAKKTAEYTGTDFSETEGAGAAGGLGFAFLSYFPNVELKSGITMVLDAVSLEKETEDSDLVITGEGRLDSQTVNGKVPAGVAALAKKHGKPVIAISGSLSHDANICNEKGIDAFFSIVRGPITLEEAMETEKASQSIAGTVEQIIRLYGISKNKIDNLEADD